MATRPQEKPQVVLFPTTYLAANTEREQEGYELKVASGGGSGCGGCFRSFCFGGWDDESHDHLLHGREQARHKEKTTWLVTKLKQLKEFSELVAGPKWKNFVRKIGKLCNPRKTNNYNKQPKTTTQFVYSPQSYALNFAGVDQDDQDELDGNLVHSFSARFAPHSSNLIIDSHDQQQKRAARPGL